MPTPTYQLRINPEQRDRWEAAARDAGYGLAEWIKATCDDRIEADAAPVKKPRGKAKVPAPGATPMRFDTGATKTGRDRTTMCVHRLRPEQHCSRGCD